MFGIFDDRFAISKKRLEVCSTCDEYDQEWKKCHKCGCFMEFKSLLPNAECPLNKWINIEKEKENGGK